MRKGGKACDDVPDPPNPSKVIEASDATVAARAPIAARIVATNDNMDANVFMVDASYVVKQTIGVKRADREHSPCTADLIEPAPPDPVRMCSDK